jgi:hypothetical protein
MDFEPDCDRRVCCGELRNGDDQQDAMSRLRSHSLLEK